MTPAAASAWASAASNSSIRPTCASGEKIAAISGVLNMGLAGAIPLLRRRVRLGSPGLEVPKRGQLLLRRRGRALSVAGQAARPPGPLLGQLAPVALAPL